MKKKICIVLACLMVFSAGGCAKAVKLTNEEQALIAEYSSYILVKHSKQNSSLLLSKEKLEKAEAFKAEQDKRAADRRAANAAASSAAGNPSSSADPGNTSGSQTGSSSASEPGSPSASQTGSSAASSAPGEIMPAAASVSMTEAIGVSGLDFTYKGYDVTDYIQGSAFSVNASPGKRLVVMNFTVSNNTGSEIVCDLKTSKTRFKGYFNGKMLSPLGTAFLPNDIASFDKNTKIKAKAKEDCVLVFDVPKDLADALTEVKLSVTKDGASDASTVGI
ncbi:MAG: hypothetical protein IK054_08765 [Lachnospiraceae bacterium]|nr:hypothetical protein [Lachnospiraceae bacterium]MBR4807686.1 hypothetical protein [Lachnospiraceae bacterium]